MEGIKCDDLVAIARVSGNINYKAVCENTQERKKEFDASSRKAFPEDWTQLDAEKLAVKNTTEKIGNREKAEKPEIYTGRKANAAVKRAYFANLLAEAIKDARAGCFAVAGVRVVSVESSDRAFKAAMKASKGSAVEVALEVLAPAKVKPAKVAAKA